MRSKKVTAEILLTLCLPLACAGAGDAGQTSAGERSSQSYHIAISAKATARASTDPGNSEVFRNAVIAAGKTLYIDSAIDFSSAPTVAVTLQCAACTSASTALSVSGLVLQARWLVQDADSYVATENKPATSFLYWDEGGAIFNVYGSQFRLALQNKGADPISIQQVTIFRRTP